MPEGWRRSLVLGLLAVVAGFILLGFISRRLPKAPESQEPALPIYPQAYQVRNMSIPDRGWRRIIFQVEEDYPSQRVLDFYTKTLGERGFQVNRPEDLPSWRPMKAEKDFRRLKLKQVWIDAPQLHLVELAIFAVEDYQWDPEKSRIIGRQIRPGQEVVLTLSRRAIVSGKQPPAD